MNTALVAMRITHMLQNALQYTPPEKLRLKEELLFLQQDILWVA